MRTGSHSGEPQTNATPVWVTLESEFWVMGFRNSQAFCLNLHKTYEEQLLSAWTTELTDKFRASLRLS